MNLYQKPSPLQKKPKSVSLLITTYNWKAALYLVLKSVQRQKVLPNEVLIADDGSTEDTKAMINQISKSFPVPIKHTWHEDKGFRAGEIRNKAIETSESEYIIQIDGDCMLHPLFVKDHLEHAKPAYFLAPSRVLLGEQKTKKILAAQKVKISFFSKDVGNRKNIIRFPFFNKMFSINTNKPKSMLYGIRGCNMSFWKSDVLKINGYDTKIYGWGREDSEFAIRLINSGVSCQRIKFSCIQYHLYHKINERNRFGVNNQFTENSIRLKKIVTENGIAPIPPTLPLPVKISCAIITKNEEKNLKRTLAAVSWVDEIVIVDSLSDDKTLEVAKQYGAKIISRKFDNFSSQKNYALEQTSNRWVLIIDADEEITAELKGDILQAFATKKGEVAYFFKRKNFFMNREIKRSGWQTDKVIRLIDKHNCSYDGALVHEKIVANGSVKTLENKLNHYTFRSVSDFMNKVKYYELLKAQELYRKGEKTSVLKTIFKANFKFFFNYLIRLGVLDGYRGFVINVINAYGVFIRYSRLWELHQLDSSQKNSKNAI